MALRKQVTSLSPMRCNWGVLFGRGQKSHRRNVKTVPGKGKFHRTNLSERQLRRVERRHKIRTAELAEWAAVGFCHRPVGQWQVLVVNNDIYDLVLKYLNDFLDKVVVQWMLGLLTM